MLRFIFILLAPTGLLHNSHQKKIKWDCNTEKAGGTYYHDITIKPDYKTKTITGNNTIRYKVISKSLLNSCRLTL
jgi:hypothetical protein